LGFLRIIKYSKRLIIMNTRIENLKNKILSKMKKVRLYIRTPFDKNEEYTICDEITDEIYASTGIQDLAIVIKNALEKHMNGEN